MSIARGDWSAIVVGGSFGGLAAAMELAGSGRVLLVDRHRIGAAQTSACATPLPVLERLSAQDAIEQVHRELVIHCRGGDVMPVTPSHQFATFDYAALCRILAGRTDAAVLQAAVLRRHGAQVVTTEGTFTAPILIDASGCRSVLAEPACRPRRLSLGLEVEMPVRGEGLHLWLRPPGLDGGLAWVFPAGERSRVGIARYRGNEVLKDRLQAFAPGAAMLDVHGGALPAGMVDPTLRGVFRVGDSAGQCLPVIGEGIRPALVYGQLAGRLARRVLERRSSLSRALRGYRRFVRRRSPYYGFLSAVQDALLAVPARAAGAFTALIATCFESPPGQALYWWAADPYELDAGSAETSTKSAAVWEQLPA